jgi:flagellar hook assembly protein FlgD
VAIRFELPTAGSTQTTIHDVAGRLVRSLQDGIMSIGVHDVAWDGHDDAGRPVAPGIYMARVSTSEGVKTARIVMLK